MKNLIRCIKEWWDSLSCGWPAPQEYIHVMVNLKFYKLPLSFAMNDKSATEGGNELLRNSLSCNWNHPAIQFNTRQIENLQGRITFASGTKRGFLQGRKVGQVWDFLLQIRVKSVLRSEKLLIFWSAWPNKWPLYMLFVALTCEQDSATKETKSTWASHIAI